MRFRGPGRYLMGRLVRAGGAVAPAELTFDTYLPDPRIERSGHLL